MHSWPDLIHQCRSVCWARAACSHQCYIEVSRLALLSGRATSASLFWSHTNSANWHFGLAHLLEGLVSTHKLLHLVLFFQGPGRAKLHCIAGTQPSQESSAATNPAWQYARDPRPGYQWNPAGSAVARLELDIPVMLLGSAAAADAQTRAQQNARQAFKGAVHHARLESAMWGADNSSACIQSQTCLPLGGHSVWAAVPPLQAGAPARQIVLAMAPVDSAAFFRSKAVVSEGTASLARKRHAGHRPRLGSGAGGVPCDSAAPLCSRAVMSTIHLMAVLEARSTAVEPAGATQHTLHTLASWLSVACFSAKTLHFTALLLPGRS